MSWLNVMPGTLPDRSSLEANDVAQLGTIDVLGCQLEFASRNRFGEGVRFTPSPACFEFYARMEVELLKGKLVGRPRAITMGRANWQD
jgi:hypothetical protein